MSHSSADAEYKRINPPWAQDSRDEDFAMIEEQIREEYEAQTVAAVEMQATLKALRTRLSELTVLMPCTAPLLIATIDAALAVATEANIPETH